MIVAVVCDVLGKENNGSTVAANNLINYLRKKGHTVHVLCSDQDKREEKDYYVVENINFYVFNKYVSENGVSLAKPDEYIIRSAIKDCDIVHIMMPFTLGIASVKIAMEMNIPISAGFHMLAENVTTHFNLEYNEMVSKLTYVHFNRLYKHCNAIHFPTEYLENLYESMFGKTNGYVISNGVNDIFKPKKVEYNNSNIQIVSSGRYSKEKSQSVLIEAIKYSKYKNNIQLVLAGASPLESELKKISRDLPIPVKFELYSRKDLVDVLNQSYLYVHPAEIEAEGISCLEAIACGIVPIICDSEKCATKSYALSEQNLFRNKNPKDLADKIDWWIGHPEERRILSKRYVEYSKDNFNQEKCMEKMEIMLYETVNNCAYSNKCNRLYNY